jgi:GT2 family glycosyltransferase
VSTTVTIIIPVRNGARFLPACLDALLAQRAATPEVTLQIVAVDNGSIDGSAELIAKHYPAVQLIRNTRNLGFAGGCNQGLRGVQSDIAILLNQDTQVQPGWLRAVVAAFADPSIGIVGCKILYLDGQTLQHAGGWFERPQFYIRHFAHHERDVGQGDQSRAVEFVTGAAFAIRRAVIEQIGLLDEAFWPGYCEDADYCLRAAAHFRIWYCAEATLIHQETSSKIDAQSIHRFYHRGRLRLTLKHLSPTEWLNEFVPAEEANAVHDPLVAQSAYVDALLHAPTLLTTGWRADEAQIRAVCAVLQRWLQSGRVVTTELTEFTFSSPTPLIGPLLSALRQLWYNVAARWAIQDLRQQQEQINQQQARQIAGLHAQIYALQQQIDGLVLANAALHQRVSQWEKEEKA